MRINGTVDYKNLIPQLMLYKNSNVHHFVRYWVFEDIYRSLLYHILSRKHASEILETI